MERPRPSLKDLQARSGQLSRTIDSRRDLISRISSGAVPPPQATDIDRFERYLSLPERLVSSVERHEVALASVQGQIGSEIAQRERIRAVYERTLEGVNSGRLPSSALESLTQAYAYLRPEASAHEPTQAGKTSAKERKAPIRGERQFSIAGLEIMLPIAQTQIMQVLRRGSAASSEISRKIDPQNPNSKNVVSYIGRINPVIRLYGIELVNVAAKGSEGIYEIRKTDYGKKAPRRTDITIDGETIAVAGQFGALYNYLSARGESVPIEDIALELFGAINRNKKIQVAVSVFKLNEIIINYGRKAVNNSSDPRRRASYELIRLGEEGQSTTETENASDNLDQLLSLKEAAMLSKVIFDNLRSVNEKLMMNNAQANPEALGRIVARYMNEAADEDRPTSDEIIKSRLELVNKLQSMFEAGLGTELYKQAEGDLEDLVLIIELLGFDFLRDTILHPEKAAYLSVSGRVEAIIDNTNRKYGIDATAPLVGRVIHENGEIILGSELGARRRYDDLERIPARPEAIQAAPPVHPAETIPARPVPTTDRLAAFSRRRKQETPKPPAPSERDPLKEKYPQVFRADPEAGKHIREIIAFMLSEMPEIWSDEDSTVGPARLTQVFNRVTQSYIEFAQGQGIVKPELRKGKAVYSASEVATLAYFKAYHDNLNMRSRVRGIAIEMVNELIEDTRAKLQLRRAAAKGTPKI